MVVLMPPSIVRAFGLLLRRTRRIVSLAVVLIAAALGGANLWAWYHFRAAEKALRDEKLEEAHGHISRCLRIWQRGPATHLLAARIERVSGNYSQAEQHLAACRRLQHGPSEQSQLEEILLRAQTGELADVEQGLWECVKKDDPDSGRILETLALVYLREGRTKTALTCLDLWVEREPSTARAWHWRGVALEGLDHFHKAVTQYEKALELEPERWGARLRLARLLLSLNNPESARPHLQELLRRHGDDVEVQLLQAQVLRLEGKTDEAVDLLDRLLQSHPHHVDALNLYSQLVSEHEPPQYDKAEHLLRLALTENPTKFSTLYTLHKCLHNQGKEKEAAEVRDRLDQMERDIRRLEHLRYQSARRTPDDPKIHCELGELLLRLGNEEAALVWLNRALRTQPAHTRAHEILIRYYESKGQTAEAERHRQYLAQLTGRSP
jgi:tetratricopeptide (TPR) repeat protein